MIYDLEHRKHNEYILIIYTMIMSLNFQKGAPPKVHDAFRMHPVTEKMFHEPFNLYIKSSTMVNCMIECVTN
jgi:hypothetical protein